MPPQSWPSTRPLLRSPNPVTRSWSTCPQRRCAASMPTESKTWHGQTLRVHCLELEAGLTRRRTDTSQTGCNPPERPESAPPHRHDATVANRRDPPCPHRKGGHRPRRIQQNPDRTKRVKQVKRRPANHGPHAWPSHRPSASDSRSMRSCH